MDSGLTVNTHFKDERITKDITRTKIGDHAVGIMDLRTTMKDMALEYRDKSDDEAAGELLRRLGKKNYIPDKAKKDYAQAFLQEFRKYLGKSYEEKPTGRVEIKVLGQGCVQCDRLERDLMEVMAEMGFAGDLEHVRDIKEIGTYGVMGMPALLINGKVMSVGRVPSKAQLEKWLNRLIVD